MKGRNLQILSYEQHDNIITGLGKHVGSMTNPEMKKFGKRVVFPVNTFIRDDFLEEKLQYRDAQLRQMMEMKERNEQLKTSEKDYAN